MAIEPGPQFEENRVSEEALKGRELFHVSPKENREKIESTGLKPQPQYGWGPKGVYLNPDEPLEQYGDDIYKVTATNLYHDLNDFGKSMFSRLAIPVSDVKRVGHFYRNNSGHTEVHWHLEEDCPHGN